MANLPLWGERTRMHSRLRRTLALVVIVLFTIVPVASSEQSQAKAMVAPAPSWMDADTAARLSLDFDVLVPGWIPAPFTEQPAVTARGGFYELYWVIIGGEPMFLDITGEVGGDIPDFSWYDRNNELQQNADVGGYPAYRDLTPIYDNVYWQVGNVVYTVSSQGLSDTNSLSLANALMRLDQTEEEAPPTSPPAPAILTTPETASSGGTVTVTVSNGNGATLNASTGTFADTGTGSYPGLSNATVSWTAPTVSEELAATFSLVDASSGSWLAGATTVVIPEAPTLDLTCTGSAEAGEQVVVTVAGSGYVAVDASAGSWPALGGNASFDESGAGGSSMSGQLAGGSTNLLWQAPVTTGGLDATISLSGMSGTTTASCVISVAPVAPQATGTPDRPSPTAEVATNESVTVPAASATATMIATSPTATDSETTSGRNRPARSSREPNATSTPRPVSRFRLPESDGTGGPLHPSFIGDSEGLIVSTPAIAPTSAPMPPAPREIRTGVSPVMATPTPTPPTSASLHAVEAVMGPEGGTVRHPLGAVLTVPAGTFTTGTVLTLRPVADHELTKRSGFEFILGTGYDIDAVDGRGREVSRLAQPVSLSIPLADDESSTSSTVFSIEANGVTEVDTTASGGTLEASLVHFSRFAAGSVSDENRSAGWLLPWFALGAIALLMLVATSVAGTVKRKRASTGRRPTRII